MNQAPTTNNTPDTSLDASIDRVLTDRGFTSNAGLGSKTWRGAIDSREYEVRLSAQSRTRYYGKVRVRHRQGYRLRIDATTTVGARAFLVRSSITDNPVVRFIYRLRRQRVLATVPAQLDGFRVVVRSQVAWAERLLGESDAVEAMAYLLREHAQPNFAGSVYFGPGTLHYASPVLAATDLTDDLLREVLNRLGILAQAAERVTPPEVAEQTTRFERLAKEHPYLTAIAILGGVLFVLGSGALFLFALMIALGALWSPG